MSVNYGKKFETIVRQGFLSVPNTTVTRIPDQTMGYRGSANICDFIVYHYPYQYFIECKTVHGNILPIYSKDPHRKYGNISNVQWHGLLNVGKIKGVYAGIICWWIDRDITEFIPIKSLNDYYVKGHKSLRYDADLYGNCLISGRKKKVFFAYNMNDFFKEVR